MADRDKLIRWFLDNSESIKLKVIKYSWPQKWLYGYSDFEVRFSIDGLPGEGRGTDKNEEHAFVKACSEAYERVACSLYKINTSGVSSHATSVMAKESARRELLERDSFLSHFLSYAPLKVLEDHNLRQFAQAQDKLRASKIEICAYEMATEAGLNSVVILANGLKRKKPFGFVVGLACRKKVIDAYEHALVEVLRNVSYYVKKTPKGKSLREFEKIDFYQPYDHKALALDVEYGEKMRAIFSEIKKVNNLREVPRANIKFKKIDCSRLSLQPPLVVFKAESNELQKTKLGAFVKDDINFHRINFFCEGSSEGVSFNKLPHPLG